MDPEKLINSYAMWLTSFTQISFHIYESMDSSQNQAEVIYLKY